MSEEYVWEDSPVKNVKKNVVIDKHQHVKDMTKEDVLKLSKPYFNFDDVEYVMERLDDIEQELKKPR